jgi:hypothetical protein
MESKKEKQFSSGMIEKSVLSCSKLGGNRLLKGLPNRLEMPGGDTNPGWDMLLQVLNFRLL